MDAARPSAWALKRKGTLNKFYTRSDVGDLLAWEMRPSEFSSVIDLGAGKGSLSAAVARHCPSAAVTTVDIDPDCLSELQKSLRIAGCDRHTHHQLDVLKADLPKEIGQQTFDLAVCNPPFFRPEWQREYADILREADLASACPTTADATAEVLFLAQCLRLLRTGGTVALIVPDGLATGQRALPFRRALLQNYALRSVAQLPPNSFMDTEARCFVLIVDNVRDAPPTNVKLLRLEDNGTVSTPIFVGPEAAETRLDYAYHMVAQSSPDGGTSLRQLGAEVRRGSLNSVQRKLLGSFVFHTGDFPNNPGPVSLRSDALAAGEKRPIIAEAGDILMARVDRELQDKVTYVAEGSAPITDCVYRIRLPERHQEQAFKALTSHRGREALKSAMKGVGARLIGKAELLDLPLYVDD